MPPEEQETSQSTTKPTTLRKKRSVLYLLCFSIAIVVALGGVLFPPAQTDFPKQLSIENGDSVSVITQKAKSAGLVRSATVLYAFLTYFHDPTAIYAGTYTFGERLTTYAVAQKLAQGDIETQAVVLTLPEGITKKEIARIAEAKLLSFSETEFLEISKGYEGKLFPETYFVPPSFTTSELLSLLSQTFESKMATIDFSKSPLSRDEVIVLASILEREANNERSMKMVSGILQNRIAADMPLQADASIEYVLSKPLKELTPNDLKIDSPYNTYLNKGLPPTPIGNPGLQAIEAVLSPQESQYFFYISDNDGNFHYARTYAEHLKNIDTYLR